MMLKSDIINLSNEREVNKMEERRNYVIYSEDGDYNPTERVVSISNAQANAIRWFMETFDIEGGVELAENYEGEEI